MFRRVRNLINQGYALANKANTRLDQAKLTLDLANALLEDFSDGFAFKLQLDENAVKTLLKVVTGKSLELPVNVIIDPEWDVFPSEKAKFVGGPYDNKTYKLSEKQQKNKTILLKGGYLYVWNGREFVFERQINSEKSDIEA